jgi:hypothetical protein
LKPPRTPFIKPKFVSEVEKDIIEELDNCKSCDKVYRKVYKSRRYTEILERPPKVIEIAPRFVYNFRPFRRNFTDVIKPVVFNNELQPDTVSEGPEEYETTINIDQTIF